MLMYDSDFNAVVEDLNSLMRQSVLANNLDIGRSLQDIRGRIEDLARTFEDQSDYLVAVSRKDISEGIEPVITTFSDAFANLIFVAQDKPARERTYRETAVMVVLAQLAEEMYEGQMGYRPHFTPQNVRLYDT